MSFDEVEEVVLDQASPAPEGGRVVKEKLYSALKDVEVSLSVVLGEAKVTIEEMLALKENGILELDRLSTAPVDILLNDDVVARGNIVVSNDNFGIKITEMMDLQ
jgi:flagellar motor switch protein FliN/FliY